MKTRKFRLSVNLALLVFAFCTGAGLSAEASSDQSSLLLKVDAYRLFADSGFTFDFGLVESNSAKKSLMRVFIRNGSHDTSIARYLEPKNYSRRQVLALGNTFYIYDPGMPAPIRVTPREMLFGQASAGDITRISFSGMYGIESQEEADGRIKLKLKALPEKGATYDRIDLVINAADNRPIQSECRGTSGALAKTITYVKYETIGGKDLLTEFTITDRASGKTSTVHLSRFIAETLPASSFTVESLKHVR